MTHSAIFKPISIRNRALKSRVGFSAHTANMAENGYPPLDAIIQEGFEGYASERFATQAEVKRFF